MVQYAQIHGDDEQEGGDSLLQHGLAMLDHLPRLHVHHLAMQDNARDIDIEVLLKMFVSCFMVVHANKQFLWGLIAFQKSEVLLTCVAAKTD